VRLTVAALLLTGGVAVAGSEPELAAATGENVAAMKSLSKERLERYLTYRRTVRDDLAKLGARRDDERAQQEIKERAQAASGLTAADLQSAELAVGIYVQFTTPARRVTCAASTDRDSVAESINKKLTRRRALLAERFGEEPIALLTARDKDLDALR
jgi:hypothetical protein